MDPASRPPSWPPGEEEPVSGRSVLLSVLAAAALIGAAWFAVGRRSQTAGETPPNRRELLLADVHERLRGKAISIDRVEISRGGASALLVRSGEQWLAPEKTGYPLDAGRVEQALKALLTLEKVEGLTADPARYGALGLAWPDDAGVASLVRLYQGDTLLAEVVTGRSLFTPPTVYARRGDDPRTWRCAGEFAAETDAIRLMNTRLLDLPGEAIGAIDWGPLRLQRGEAGRWAVDGDLAAPTRAELERLIPELFTRLEFSDIRPAGEHPAAETIRGLLGDRAVRIEFLPIESASQESEGAASGLRQAGRWFRIVVEEPQPGLAALALPEAIVAQLEEIKARTTGREFSVPAWRSERLAALAEQVAARDPGAMNEAQPAPEPPLDQEEAATDGR